MIKIDNRSITVPFSALDVGDTFIGGDGKYYIKITAVTKVRNSECYGSYTSVCITDGELVVVAEEQQVIIVNITGIVVP